MPMGRVRQSQDFEQWAALWNSYPCPPMFTARRGAMMLAGLLMLAGCGGESTSPTNGAAATSDLLGSTLGTATGTVSTVLTSITALQRTTPLAADITVSQTIGSAGGVLAIPAAGITVVVPVGAVASPTLFTMTARKGSSVAYDFAPHGITFAKPLVMTQSLVGTNATLLNYTLLKIGYYADPSQLTSTGGVLSELTSGVVSLLSWSFTANIKHFSGYMIACGRE